MMKVVPLMLLTMAGLIFNVAGLVELRTLASLSFGFAIGSSYSLLVLSKKDKQ